MQVPYGQESFSCGRGNKQQELFKYVKPAICGLWGLLMHLSV